MYHIYSRVQPFIWATTDCHACWGKISCQWNKPYKNSIILAWEEQAYPVTGSLVQDKLRSSQKCTRTLVRKERVKKQEQIQEEGEEVISHLSSHNVPAVACLQVTEAILNNSFITNNVLYSITIMSNLLGLPFSTAWPLKKHFLFSVKCITQGVTLPMTRSLTSCHWKIKFKLCTLLSCRE